MITKIFQKQEWEQNLLKHESFYANTLIKSVENFNEWMFWENENYKVEHLVNIYVYKIINQLFRKYIVYSMF